MPVAACDENSNRLTREASGRVAPTVAVSAALHSRLIGSCLRRGANWAHGILNSSRNLIPYAGESDNTWEKGDSG